VAGELIAAIEAEDEDRIRRLLEERPELADERDDDGVSALLTALYRGAETAAEAVRRAKPNLDVFEAAAVGDVERLRELLREDPALARAWTDDGFTALHYAAFFDGADAARTLLDAGADPDARARHSQIKVHPIHSAAASQQIETVRLLLDRGADVNTPQEGGGTPLHTAAFHGDDALAELLLERGADPQAAGDDGRTAADIAAEKGHAGLAARLRGSSRRVDAS
jgi:ankyrin repeat protein